MENLLGKERIKVENLIYEKRGVQVMLDSDLAKLYSCKMLLKQLIKQLKDILIGFLKEIYNIM